MIIINKIEDAIGLYEPGLKWKKSFFSFHYGRRFERLFVVPYQGFDT